MWKVLWQRDGHMTFFEMARQQREAHQQAKQIGEDDPLVANVGYKTDDAGTCLEAGEGDFVDRNRHQSGERDAQGMMMKYGHPGQREPEQNKIDRNAEQGGNVRRKCAYFRHRHVVAGIGAPGNAQTCRRFRAENCAEMLNVHREATNI